MSEKEELQQFLDDMEEMYAPSIGSGGKARATIAKTKTDKTTLASAEEISTLPLAQKDVKPCDLVAIRQMLNPQGLKQLDDGLAALLRPDTVCDIVPDSFIPVSYGAPSSAFKNLERDTHCIEFVSAATMEQHPTKSAGYAMWVKETKQCPTTRQLINRVRFIHNPKRNNAALKSPTSRYINTTHMYGPAHYLPAIRHEAAAVGDISSGFSHIEIPFEARAWFRMKDEDGNIWQMTRLPMGHTASVQIMEVITHFLVGSSLVCKSEHALPTVRTDVFVDDFRFAGTEKRVNHALDFTRRRAARYNITLKEGQQTAATDVIFLGVKYDHNNKTVTISEKTLSKLPRKFESSRRAGDLHRDVSRLIYCSGPLGINIGQFYFSMKHITKICSQINNGHIDEDTMMTLTSHLQHSLQRWRDMVHESRSYRGFDWDQQQKQRRCILFTDASLHGWGAFLITADGCIFIVGGRWSDTYRSGDINHLEARAVKYAFQAFAQIIKRHTAVSLRVDNTSVGTAMRRGRGRAAEIHVEVIETHLWLQQQKITLDTSEVSSKDNHADFVSRLETGERD